MTAGGFLSRLGPGVHARSGFVRDARNNQSMARQRAASEAGGWSRFGAESDYAQSILCTALGDGQGCLEALRSSLQNDPTYAPAILSLGSVEYQLSRADEGRRLFMSLLELSDDTEHLTEIIDETGDFLISIGAYADGLELFRAGASRFPQASCLLQGVSCCAGHLGLHEEALAASAAGLELEPDDQELVTDLGWSLYLAGRLEDARDVLSRAAAMDPTDELAANNLRACEQAPQARAA
jgi:tetratricopeptide (TPR) repeat protein